MSYIDWGILLAFFVFLFVSVIATRKYAKSVADFLAVNRCAGRYIITVSDAMIAFSLTSAISFFEIYYDAGFTAQWWLLAISPVILVVMISGWVAVRFRQTRSLTLLQFLEQRYSKRFRIFVGILSFIVFLITMGIMPGIGARFFINMCGFPQSVTIAGFNISMLAIIMFIFLGTALFFTFIGGQIAVLVINFLQGMICNVAFLVLMIAAMFLVDWSTLMEGLKLAPPEASMIDPFHTGNTKDYNLWYFMIMGFYFFFVYPTWQGPQAYMSSAKSPHELLMAKVLGPIRGLAIYSALLVLPVLAFVILKHPSFADTASQINTHLGVFGDSYLQRQMTVPIAMKYLLPAGLLGLFLIAMLGAMVTTDDTLLLAWGSIFVQDIVLPFKKKPFDPKTHIRLLKIATLGVAIFVFFFSLFFKQNQDIVMFWAIVGTFYYGGAGAVIIFGLYWKRGTTAAAWTAMIVGIILTGICLYIQTYHPEMGLPNSQWLSFWIALIAIGLYITVSLLSKNEHFDMDRMLHRGKYAVESDQTESNKKSFNKFEGLLGITKDFTKWDRLIYYSIIIYTVATFLIFLVITGIGFVWDLSNNFWSKFWLVYIWHIIVIGVVVTIWFTIGGALDLKHMFKSLASAKRNDLDDGMVVDHHNLGE